MCVVQFTSALYIVHEHEDYVVIGIMRLGSLLGTSSVAFHTEDSSAEHGLKYVAAKGIVTMCDGENYKEIHVGIKDDHRWAPTTEFKVRLSQPGNCELGGAHHATCRVKIVDDSGFPSSKYRNKAGSADAIDTIPEWGLFWEFLKLVCFHRPVLWRTVATLAFDQVHNLYFLFTLYINVYLVDCVFSDDFDRGRLLIPNSREGTLVAMGVMYMIFVLLVHLWDYAKVQIDLPGITAEFLQKCLIRRFMNFTAQSQSQSRPTILLNLIINDVVDVAEGYVSVLDLVRTTVKLNILACFIITDSPDSKIFIFVLPVVMILFGYCRHGKLAHAGQQTEDKLLDFESFTEEICNKINIIAEFSQRPKMDEAFRDKADAVRFSSVDEHKIRLNNRMFPTWLGAVSIGIMLMVGARSVTHGKISVGTFLATIQVIQTISTDFSAVYTAFMNLAKTMDPLKGLTFIFNLEVDLVGRERLLTERARYTQEMLARARQGEPGADCGEHEADRLVLRGIHFGYVRSKPLFSGANASVSQGKLVAVVGPANSGKATLMRLIGQMLFPSSGCVLIPLHLRVLHISREPMLFRGSPWQNLTFGFERDAPPVGDERVMRVLRLLDMETTDRLLKEPACQRISSVARPSVHWREPTDSATLIAGSAGVSPQSEQFTLLRSRRANKKLTTWRAIAKEPTEHFSAASLRRGSIDEGRAEDGLDTSDAVDEYEWFGRLPYTEKVKLMIARALIFDPEVLVLQRPLHAGDVATLVLAVLARFVSERGLSSDAGPTPHCRQMRTCFFTPESIEQAAAADVVWQIDSTRSHEPVFEVSLDQLGHDFVIRHRSAEGLKSS